MLSSLPILKRVYMNNVQLIYSLILLLHTNGLMVLASINGKS